jgi:hypothetical protein
MCIRKTKAIEKGFRAHLYTNIYVGALHFLF